MDPTPQTFTRFLPGTQGPPNGERIEAWLKDQGITPESVSVVRAGAGYVVVITADPTAGTVIDSYDPASDKPSGEVAADDAKTWLRDNWQAIKTETLNAADSKRAIRALAVLMRYEVMGDTDGF